jgi:hypothetical protein
MNQEMNTERRVLKEIGLHAQYLWTILNVVVNIITETLYDHLMRKRIFTLMMSWIFIRALETKVDDANMNTSGPLESSSRWIQPSEAWAS